jgi:glycosyltransferase involved in cell wall biosynthesis
VGRLVRFVPAQPFEDMPAYLAAADILVSPRVCGVNAPGKLMSYLQSGRPVVATDCPVHNQLLDSARAFLTPPTPEGLAAGILRALENPTLAAAVAACARDFARLACAPDVRTAEYHTLLTSCTSRH